MARPRTNCLVVVLVLVAALSQVSDCTVQRNPLQLPDPQQNVMPFEPVRYSRANVSNNYQSTTKFNARGMGHLYYITKKFMDFILQDQPFPEGWLDIDGSTGKVIVGKDWKTVGLHYGRMVAVVALGLLLAAFLPLAGLVFCCCRCLGRCGARTRPFDSRHDTCRRHSYAFFLSSVTVLIMFGVVCAFVTNEYMAEGARGLPNNVRTSLRDTQLYLNNTKQEVNTLLVTNFAELDTVLNRLLHRSGEIVKNKLGEISKAAVLANLTRIVSGLRAIKSDLHSIDHLTKELQDHALNLEIALKEVRGDLLDRLEMCRKEKPCMDFLAKYNITSLSLEANFTQLPDVTLSLQNVSALLASDIEAEVLKGKEEFDRIKFSIQGSVDKIIPEISKEINKAGKVLKNKAGDVTMVLDRIQRLLEETSYKPIDQAEGFLNRFGHYRYYGGLGISCALLAVLSCLGLGLLCGYCGKRPDHYSDDCCDKGTASRFLLLGVWLMLLTGSALIIISLAGMVGGSVAEKGVCGALREPTKVQTFSLLDKFLNISRVLRTDHPLNLSTVITECHKNSSIYKVLGLETSTVGTDYVAQFNIPDKVQQLADSIVLGGSITIITPTAENQLRALAASTLNNIDLTVYTSVLNDKITSIDLLQMAVALNQTSEKLPPTQSEVKRFLLTKAMYLETHQERQVAVMQRVAAELHANASLLSHHLRFNHSSLKEAVDLLLVEVNHAQQILNTQGPHIVRKLAEEFGSEFSIHIDEYLGKVEREGRENVGRCWPMSTVYNATVIATCNNLLDPLNGFWLSVGWIVLLYLPALVLAVKLSTLYQKSEPYPGAIAESEYLYDTYADRDNIPLANVGGVGGGGVGGDKKRNKKKKTYKKAGEGGVGVYPRPPRPAQHPPEDSRQWEELGPPRYQSPPMSSEYERPPPYYFPGPNQSGGQG